MKSGVSPYKNYEKTVLANEFYGVSTILRVSGLDLHSSNPEPINFFGAQSSLGGHNFRLGGHRQSFGVGTAPECPGGAVPGHVL